MSLIVGVRFSGNGKLYYFDPAGMELKVGDNVLVNTRHGNDVGQVVLGPSEVADTGITSPLKKILGIAENAPEEKAEPDAAVHAAAAAQPRKKPGRTIRKEQDAFRICEDRIRRRGLPMKLIDVESAPESGKIVFYFAAEGRIDFRELVKDLASVFRTRIELRQIGVRDEAKKIGGLGPCGRPCCCNEFLHGFAPVSIKMAKEQNLSLSPTKISGLCGRLMCCLHFENEHYHEMCKKLPHVGSWVNTPDGPAQVYAADALTGRIRGKIALPDHSYDIRTYELEDTARIPAPKPGEEAVAGGDSRGRVGHGRFSERAHGRREDGEAKDASEAKGAGRTEGAPRGPRPKTGAARQPKEARDTKAQQGAPKKAAQKKRPRRRKPAPKAQPAQGGAPS